MTVLPQRKANMALGVMGLPHNYAIKNQDFSKSHKYHVSASKAKKFKKESAYAQGRRISRISFREAKTDPNIDSPNRPQQSLGYYKNFSTCSGPQSDTIDVQTSHIHTWNTLMTPCFGWHFGLVLEG